MLFKNARKRVILFSIIMLFIMQDDTLAISIAEDYDIGSTEVCAFICGYYGSESDLVIPSAFYILDDLEMPLGYIDERAFSGNDNLRNVVIPEGVTEIGPYAFAECHNLESVVLPKSLVEIPYGCFAGDTALKLVVMSEEAISIDDYAFSGCESLAKVSLPQSIAYIGNGAFEGCSCLVSIVLPDSLDYVGDNVFSGCQKLKLGKQQRKVLLNATEISNKAKVEYFIPDISELKDLAPFLNTDFDDFANYMLKQTGLEPEEVLSGSYKRYYSDETVEFGAEPDKLIDYVMLESVSDYCIHGLYVQMDEQEAHDKLQADGWKIELHFGLEDYVYRKGDSNISFSVNENNKLSQVLIGYYDSDEMDGQYLVGNTIGNVNLRSGPTLNDNIVTTIQTGQSVEYLGNSSIDERGVVWYNIRFENQEGWGSSKYIMIY